MSDQPKPRKHGGKRDGAGRKPDWLKEKCKTLIDRNKLMNYLANVASGKETEQQVVVMRGDRGSSSYEVVDVKCSTKDRLHAIDMLLERGFGKPTETVDLRVNVGYAELLKNADKRAGFSD